MIAHPVQSQNNGQGFKTITQMNLQRLANPFVFYVNVLLSVCFVGLASRPVAAQTPIPSFRQFRGHVQGKAAILNMTQLVDAHCLYLCRLYFRDSLCPIYLEGCHEYYVHNEGVAPFTFVAQDSKLEEAANHTYKRCQDSIILGFKVEQHPNLRGKFTDSNTFEGIYYVGLQPQGNFKLKEHSLNHPLIGQLVEQNLQDEIPLKFHGEWIAFSKDSLFESVIQELLGRSSNKGQAWNGLYQDAKKRFSEFQNWQLSQLRLQFILTPIDLEDDISSWYALHEFDTGRRDGGRVAVRTYLNHQRRLLRFEDVFDTTKMTAILTVVDTMLSKSRTTEPWDKENFYITEKGIHFVISDAELGQAGVRSGLEYSFPFDKLNGLLNPTFAKWLNSRQ
jgi:hypothetical protein